MIGGPVRFDEVVAATLEAAGWVRSGRAVASELFEDDAGRLLAYELGEQALVDLPAPHRCQAVREALCAAALTGAMVGLAVTDRRFAAGMRELIEVHESGDCGRMLGDVIATFEGRI